MIVVVDTETGGFSPTANSLLSVALVKLDDNLEITEQDYFLVKHDFFNVSPKAMEINGLDLEEIRREGLTTLEARQRVVDFVGDAKPTPAGHNVKFDIDFLNAQLDNVVREHFHYGNLDTKTVAAYLKLRGSIDVESTSLGPVCQALGIELTGAHNALADAVATAQLLRTLVRMPL